VPTERSWATPELPDVPLASIWRRALARSVDLLILFVPAIAAVVAIPWIVVAVPVFLLLLLAGAAQDVFGTARWGQSAGKALFGIRVVNERDGRPPDLFHSFLRWWLPNLLPPLLVWATWDKRRQGIHDKAAETLVVRTPERHLQTSATTPARG
jgi:uncharacterized RDD family membrane protein YckC